MSIISTSVVLLDLVAYLAVAGAENPICIAENEGFCYENVASNLPGDHADNICAYLDPMQKTHSRCTEGFLMAYKNNNCGASEALLRRRLNCPVIRTHKKCDVILYGDYRAKTCDDFAPHVECLFPAQMSACDNSTEFKVQAYKHKLLELASLETRRCRGEYIKAFKDAIHKIEDATDSSA